MMYAGIMLQICVCACVLRPREFYTKRRTKQRRPFNKQGTKSFGISLTDKSIQLNDWDLRERDSKSEGSAEYVQSKTNKRNVSSSSSSAGGTIDFDFSLFRNVSFVFVFVAFGLGMFGIMGVFHSLPPYLRENGYSNFDISFFLFIIGCCELITRLAAGFILDIKVIKENVRLSLVTATCAVLAGVATFTFPFLTRHGLLVAYSVVFGSAASLFDGLVLLVCVSCVGRERAHLAMVYLYMPVPATAASAPLVAGEQQLRMGYRPLLRLLGRTEPMISNCALFDW